MLHTQHRIFELRVQVPNETMQSQSAYACKSAKNSSMTVQLRHACGCDARMFEQKQKLLMIYFGLKGRVELQQYYC